MSFIAGVTNIPQMTKVTGMANKSGSADFTKALDQALSNITESEKNDDSNTEQLLAGNIDNIASQMVDMVEADIALQFTMQVRNKIVDAYQEIMRMQI
ncbi:MAG: flagellar hook-basal body complex protein FliE [Clostridia bacterium]|nr:flagellar hook-basal body complex protein FliE [Clostridia bacterium]